MERHIVEIVAWSSYWSEQIFIPRFYYKKTKSIKDKKHPQYNYQKCNGVVGSNLVNKFLHVFLFYMDCLVNIGTKLQQKTEICKEAKVFYPHVVTSNTFLPNFQSKRGERRWLISDDLKFRGNSNYAGGNPAPGCGHEGSGGGGGGGGSFGFGPKIKTQKGLIPLPPLISIISSFEASTTP
ncbi:MAG: hypothetical protein LBH22_01875 [Bacteroidales bacterium]|jgi:uncharacterized membrane protein YgcG|nr:hypothetical protein [Bacteroidales bacterium]